MTWDAWCIIMKGGVLKSWQIVEWVTTWPITQYKILVCSVQISQTLDFVLCSRQIHSLKYSRYKIVPWDIDHIFGRLIIHNFLSGFYSFQFCSSFAGWRHVQSYKWFCTATSHDITSAQSIIYQDVQPDNAGRPLWLYSWRWGWAQRPPRAAEIAPGWCDGWDGLHSNGKSY